MLLQRLRVHSLLSAVKNAKLFLSPHPLSSNYSASKVQSEKRPPVYSDWETIYQFPLIRKISVVNRLKNYQAGLCLIGCPVLFVMESMGTIPISTAVVFSALGLTGAVTLSLFSAVTSNLIGFVYVNDAEKLVRLGHINFWGKRKNAEIPFSDLIPTQERLFGLYMPVKCSSNPESYKLIIRFGDIKNPATFTELFGTESF